MVPGLLRAQRARGEAVHTLPAGEGRGSSGLRLHHPVSLFELASASDDLAMRADAALYEAKAMGRKRIHQVREPAALA